MWRPMRSDHHSPQHGHQHRKLDCIYNGIEHSKLDRDVIGELNRHYLGHIYREHLENFETSLKCLDTS